MKNKSAIIKLFAAVLLLTIAITFFRAIMSHEVIHQQLNDAVTLHIAAIESDMEFAVDHIYAVQALIVGVNGQDVSLESVAPVLKRDEFERFVRFIAVAPNGIVRQIYPIEGNEVLLGDDLFSEEYSTSIYSEQAIKTGELVITSPYIMHDGALVIDGRLSVMIPQKDGSLKEWGLVSICISFPEMFENLHIDALDDYGFAYKIFLIDENGAETPLVDHAKDGITHSVTRDFSIADNKLRIIAGPSESIFDPLSTIVFFFVTLIVLITCGCLLELLIRRFTNLRKEATADPLTGLLNRASGRRKINSILQSKSFERAAFIIMDIDYFKNVNDLFGHGVGDELLVRCSELLSGIFRKNDVVCRLGGDEFVVFIPFSGSEGFLVEKIEQLLNVMRRDIEHEGTTVHISTSIGVSFAPDHGLTSRELYKQADDALYISKKRGRDCVTYFGRYDKLLGNNTETFEVTKSYRTRNCVLIVDDDVINNQVMKNIFKLEYTFEEAENGLDGLKMVEELEDKLLAIILDVNMPGMGGLDILRTLNERGITSKIPVFIVTAHDESEIAKEAYDLGAMDVIVKPVNPYIIMRRIRSVIDLYKTREALSERVVGQQNALRESKDKIDALHRNTIETLAAAIEFRTTETEIHTNLIYKITKLLLEKTEMGSELTTNEIEDIAIASIMHDIGKIATPDAILNKPGPLTPEEFEIMKEHTVRGGEVLEQICKTQDHPSYVFAKDIARHHHERWDGNGYPDKLKGNEITVWSQVVSIADVYDALVSPRIYKRAYSADEASQLILSGQCGVFNPKLIEAFKLIEPEIRLLLTSEKSSADEQAEKSTV